MTGEKDWSKHSGDRFDNQHYSSMYHLPASAGRLATLGVVLDGRNCDAVAACLVKTIQVLLIVVVQFGAGL